MMRTVKSSRYFSCGQETRACRLLAAEFTHSSLWMLYVLHGGAVEPTHSGKTATTSICNLLFSGFARIN